MSMMKSLPSYIVGCIALVAVAGQATADEKKAGCDSFLWPLTTEIALIKSAESITADTGDALPAPPIDKAIALSLKPAPEVQLPAKPTSTPKADDASKFAGFVNFTKAEKGHYQVTMSGPGWIDVIQNATPLEATGHTGSPGCEFVRKSVRFEISEGPLTIQVHGVLQNSLKITIRPAAD
jgi:hypothetical protein